MHLVSPLISGVRGCENGTAELYRRGTATRATYYASFEGYAPVSTGADVTLDANGGAEVYVGELVDVVCKAADGLEVRRFVAGDSASSVEVRSAAFTGSDYDDGSGVVTSGTSRPANLGALMDLWMTNNGSPDWKVRFGGVDKTIKSALSSLEGLVFNVMDPQFGAVGDGVADDSAAVQAAIDAAYAAGGATVFFPANTYKLLSSVTLKDGVVLLGASVHGTNLNFAHATAAGIVATGRQWSIQRINLYRTGGGTGPLVESQEARGLVRDVRFNVGNSSGGGLKINGGSSLYDTTVIGCNFDCGAGYSGILCAVSGFSLTVLGCSFSSGASAVANGAIHISQSGTLRVGSCKFKVANGGAPYAFAISCTAATAAYASVSGCVFDGPSNTCAFSWLTATGVLVESGSMFVDPAMVSYDPASSEGTIRLDSRQTAYVDIGDNANPVDLDPEMLQYGTIRLKRTSGAATTFTINGAPSAPLGSRCRLAVWCDGVGGSSTITLGNNIKETGTFACADNSIMIFDLVALNGNGASAEWYLCGTPAVAPE